MPKEPKTEPVVIVEGYDYSPLAAPVAERARTAAARIRERVKKTLEDIIEVGNDLLAVKDALPHGQFLPWLRAEFGWTERTARNFMSVAEQFGAKTEIISDLRIAPTAAYLLAAPSAPDEARQAAIERAEAGETITTSVAKEILAESRKKEPKRGKRVSAEKLAPKLVKVLEHYRERWNPKELAALAQQLREFADGLGESKGGGKRPRAKE